MKKIISSITFSSFLIFLVLVIFFASIFQTFARGLSINEVINFSKNYYDSFYFSNDFIDSSGNTTFDYTNNISAADGYLPESEIIVEFTEEQLKRDKDIQEYSLQFDSDNKNNNKDKNKKDEDVILETSTDKDIFFKDANLSWSRNWVIYNKSSLAGQLYIYLDNIVNLENGCNDQEQAVEPDCYKKKNIGDLGKLINLKIALDGEDVLETTLEDSNEDQFAKDWAKLVVNVDSKEKRVITAHWFLDENSYGNEIQSDSVSFDISFRLIQIYKSDINNGNNGNGNNGNGNN